MQYALINWSKDVVLSFAYVLIFFKFNAMCLNSFEFSFLFIILLEPFAPVAAGMDVF